MTTETVKLAIVPEVNQGTGIVRLHETLEIPGLGETIKQLSMFIADTREKSMRKALIELGWTPPELRKSPGRRISDRQPGTTHFILINPERRHRNRRS